MIARDETEQLPPQLKMSLDAEEKFTSSNVTRNVQNRGWSEIVQLEAVVFQKPSEERMDWKSNTS